MPLLVLSGNRFLAEERLPDLLGERGLQLRDLPRFAGEEVTPELLGPHLNPGLFGEGGVIVDFEGLKPDKALLELLSSAAVTVVVLDEAPPPTRLKLYQKVGELVVSAAPGKPGEVLTWTLQRAKGRQLPLERDAAAYLAEVFGGDLAAIAGELHKLEFLEGPFTRQRVQAVVGREPPGDSFAMLAAAAGGRAAEAVGQLRRLLASGEDPFRLLGAIVWQYSLVARCVGLLQEEGRVGEAVAAQRLGVKPFPARKALEVARRLSESRIQLHLGRILEADLALKRGQEPAAVLERLLVQLSV